MAQKKREPSAVNGKALDRAAILAAEDAKREKVEIPEWNGHVFVRSMTGLERDKFDERLSDLAEKSPNESLRPILIALTAVDEKNELIFSEADVKEINKKNAAALNRIFTVARRLNGLAPEDIEARAKN